MPRKYKQTELFMKLCLLFCHAEWNEASC